VRSLTRCVRTRTSPTDWRSSPMTSSMRGVPSTAWTTRCFLVPSVRANSCSFRLNDGALLLELRLTPKEKKELTAEEKEYKSKRKLIQEKLVKFVTRIPAFMYLTDFRENTLQDVITKLEPDLFKTVTGLSVDDFHLLASLGVFNSIHMNQAVFAFRRYEHASLSDTGVESHPGLRHYGLYDTVVAVDAPEGSTP
jgi:hypothetical protein